MPPDRNPPAAASRRRRVRLLLGLVAAACVTAAYFACWRYHAKRWQEVRPGVFYRVAQPSQFGLWYLVKRCGVKTVLSVQLHDFRLHRGLYDPGEPDGGKESEYVAGLGARHLQWPMGDEACWPWLTPWQFEEFFKLLDDPGNLPVAVHCMGGRHRTGTLAALFRLEYDRWPVERALEEMYGFDFGEPIALQEHNLRTYLPRPRPTAAAWAELRRFWGGVLERPPVDYDELVRQIRHARARPAVSRALDAYVRQKRPFALPLVQRILDGADDPLAPEATELALAYLERADASRASWAMSAALVADFGTPYEQRQLLARLADDRFQRACAPRFDAVVAGVTNRYTPNRIAFLRPLVENESPHLEPPARGFRYCDTAVARLSAILDRNLLSGSGGHGREAWNQGRQAARAWFDEHPARALPGRLRPPTGKTVVRVGDPPAGAELGKVPGR